MKLTTFALALCATGIACASKPEGNAESKAAAPAASTAAAPAPAGIQDTSLTRADKARIIGSESAKVWLVMASDFQCPYCRAFENETWPQIYQNYVQTGKVRVAFLNHPMPFHQLAIPAAEAAMCAGKQDKFWPMHDKLFASQDEWVKSGNPAPLFEAMATSLGLRMDDWRACVSSHATQAFIESDYQKAERGGVKGTPSFFIANQFAIEGAAPYADFRKALDSALMKAGGR